MPQDREITVRRKLIAAMLAALLSCKPVLAQVGGIGMPIPGIGATSPLGMVPSSPTLPLGIPLGATELASPGLSPVPTGSLGMTGGCGPSSGMSGANSVYDGGGMTVGTGSSFAGSTTAMGTCGAAPSSSASAATAPTSTTSAGGAARAGIPLDSVEIGNAGISPLVTVPAPSPLTMEDPSTIGSGAPCSIIGSSMSATSC